jgi:hypothetical protein
MKRLLVIFLLLSLATGPVRADDAYESAHTWDHIGISFALQTFLYGFANQALTLDKPDSLVFSAVLTFALGFTYSYMQALNRNDVGGERLCKDVLLNGLGQGLAVGNIRVWSW